MGSWGSVGRMGGGNAAQFWEGAGQGWSGRKSRTKPGEGTRFSHVLPGPSWTSDPSLLSEAGGLLKVKRWVLYSRGQIVPSVLPPLPPQPWAGPDAQRLSTLSWDVPARPGIPTGGGVMSAAPDLL